MPPGFEENIAALRHQTLVFLLSHPIQNLLKRTVFVLYLPGNLDPARKVFQHVVRGAAVVEGSWLSKRYGELVCVEFLHREGVGVHLFWVKSIAITPSSSCHLYVGHVVPTALRVDSPEAVETDAMLGSKYSSSELALPVYASSRSPSFSPVAVSVQM